MAKPISVEIKGLKQLNKLTKANTRKIVDNLDRVEIVALKTIEAFHKRRIFNASKASDGSSLGDYKSKPYRKKRQQAGRQIGRKDLQFSGDLKNNMQVGRSGNGNVYQFTTDLARLIMEAQKNKTQVGKTVHELTSEELALGIKVYLNEYNKLF